MRPFDAADAAVDAASEEAEEARFRAQCADANARRDEAWAEQRAERAQTFRADYEAWVEAEANAERARQEERDATDRYDGWDELWLQPSRMRDFLEEMTTAVALVQAGLTRCEMCSLLAVRRAEATSRDEFDMMLGHSELAWVVQQSIPEPDEQTFQLLCAHSDAMNRDKVCIAVCYCLCASHCLLTLFIFLTQVFGCDRIVSGSQWARAVRNERQCTCAEGASRGRLLLTPRGAEATYEAEDATQDTYDLAGQVLARSREVYHMNRAVCDEAERRGCASDLC